MDVKKNGDRVLIDLSIGEALALAARIGEVMGIGQDEMDKVFEEVLG